LYKNKLYEAEHILLNIPEVTDVFTASFKKYSAENEDHYKTISNKE